MIAAAVHGPSPLWYATRGAGAVTLVLLTASVVLGIAQVQAWGPARVPRFAVAALHRALSLLALALLAVHVVTTLLDPFPPIGVVSAVVPFSGSYRPFWLGLGALASDILIALVVTSVVRRRLGYRAWRGVHLAAYACWPVALLHGLGTGSDVRATWMLALALACAAAVLVAIAGRMTSSDIPSGTRVGVLAASVASVLALGLWLEQGPLAPGWAKRSGTPAAVLAAFAGPRPAAVAAPPRAAARRAAPRPRVRSDALASRFDAQLVGRLSQGLSAGGTAVVDLRFRLVGGPPGRLRIRIAGRQVAGGGVAMDRSAVTLGPRADPGRYQGRIETLDNTDLEALVGSGAGRAVRLRISLSLQGTHASGVVHATPARGTTA